MGRFLINFQVNGFSSSKWSNGVSGCRPKMRSLRHTKIISALNVGLYIIARARVFKYYPHMMLGVGVWASLCYPHIVLWLSAFIYLV